MISKYANKYLEIHQKEIDSCTTRNWRSFLKKVFWWTSVFSAMYLVSWLLSLVLYLITSFVFQDLVIIEAIFNFIFPPFWVLMAAIWLLMVIPWMVFEAEDVEYRDFLTFINQLTCLREEKKEYESIENLLKIGLNLHLKTKVEWPFLKGNDLESMSSFLEKEDYLIYKKYEDIFNSFRETPCLVKISNFSKDSKDKFFLKVWDVFKNDGDKELDSKEAKVDFYKSLFFQYLKKQFTEEELHFLWNTFDFDNNQVVLKDLIIYKRDKLKKINNSIFSEVSKEEGLNKLNDSFLKENLDILSEKDKLTLSKSLKSQVIVKEEEKQLLYL